MKQVIFFDGVCFLCNGFVDFLLRRDREGLFLFAPLQGEQAKVSLPASLREDLGSVVLLRQGQAFTQSDAVLMIVTQLGGAWGLLRAAWAIPKVLRDLLYRFVASRRYSLFGKRNTCRMPNPTERERFLS